MTGNSKNRIKNYNWSYDDKSLYFADELVSLKVYGIIVCSEKFIKYLRKPFEQLNIVAYVVRGDNISTCDTLITNALTFFYEGVNNCKLISDHLLNLIKILNIKYENKYLDYCRKLNADDFLKITKKHNDRKANKGCNKKLNGLWYS